MTQGIEDRINELNKHLAEELKSSKFQKMILEMAKDEMGRELKGKQLEGAVLEIINVGNTRGYWKYEEIN